MKIAKEVDMSDQPLAYFITWTVYGTWLQGDERGWRRYRGGFERPRPLLAHWRREKLLYPIILLDEDKRQEVRTQIANHSDRRGWRLWVANPRTNHVHVVVSAIGYSGAKVRDQLKANCTKGLRSHDNSLVDRPVWSRGGDWKCVNSGDELQAVILYASDVQDAKGN